MKLLITGAKGQLGNDCCAVMSSSHEVIAVDLDELDITNHNEVRAFVAEAKPDCIVNCAAFTQVDACEKQEDLAMAVNAKGPENLAMAISEQGGTLFHVSTDYVFDGCKKVPEPYTEKDETGPLSFYGKTKLAGEEAVRRRCQQHAIIRTAWLYGVHGHNILKTFLKLALCNSAQPIKVVDDQFGSPTWSHRLAEQIQACVNGNVTGTVHATAEGYCSWYELAAYFLQTINIPHQVVPCTTEEYPTPASRPKNSILENGRLKQLQLNCMKHWKEDVDTFVHLHRHRLLEEIKRVA